MMAYSFLPTHATCHFIDETYEKTCLSTGRLEYFIETFRALCVNIVRNPLERLVTEQLTIKATEKKNCYRKDASTLSPAWIPLLPHLLT